MKKKTVRTVCEPFSRSRDAYPLAGERTFTYTGRMSDNVKKLVRFYRAHRRMPSLSELMMLAGYRSKNAAHKLVRRLVADGVVAKDERGRLIPRNLYGTTRVLGTVQAGFPSPAEEELADTMTMDEFLIRNREATFMLKVNGDSMKDAGIMAGDMVLAERGRTAREGDIVIAEVDTGWTMKYLAKRNGRVCLLPANRTYKPIYPREELNIAAVVTAVVRKY